MLLLPLLAAAWDGIGAVWPDEAFPLPYEVSADFGELDDAEALAAVQAGFDTWAAVECAQVSFTYLGRTDATDFGAADGRNLVLYAQSGWPDDASLVSAPAVTVEGTSIVDADLALNAVNYAWSTDGDGRVLMDLQSAVTHEVGHLLGLWHSTTTDATLNPANDGHPLARDLAQDDIDGVCALYPRDAAGTGEQGEACTGTADCVEGLVCLSDAGARYCTAPCDANGGCPDGYACLAAGEGEEICALEAETGCGGCSTPGRGAPAAVLAGLMLLHARAHRQVRRAGDAGRDRAV